MPNAKIKLKLTKTIIEGLEPRTKEYSAWDAQVEGFHVRVFPSGSRVFYAFYRAKRGNMRRRPLGPYPTVKVDEAREQARSLISAAKQGKDPFGEQDAQRAIPRLASFWTVYWEEHALPKKAARSSEQDEQLWNKHVQPTFGEMFVDQIDASRVRRWHAKLSGTPGAANRALALLSKICSMCIQSGYITSNPCRFVEKYPENQRDPTFTSDDIRNLWDAAHLEENEGDEGAGRAVKLIMLTGARRFEVLNARWGDFDLEEGDPTWRVPKENLKGGKRLQTDVTRNLSRDTRELVLSWRPIGHGAEQLLFPSSKLQSEARFDIKKPWDRIRKGAGRSDLRLHDLRHLFATLAIGEGNTLEEIGETLGHRCPTTTRRYAHIVARQKSRVANSVSSKIFAARPDSP